MTDTAPLREDIIDAVFRPVMAFFAGMFAAYVTQLAGATSWTVALIFGGICLVLFGLVLVFDNFMRGAVDGLFERIGWGSVKHKQLAPIPRKRTHWFVRYGWILGLIAGFLAVMVLPEEALAWL